MRAQANIKNNVALVDKRLVEYEIEEQRILNLSNVYTGGALRPHQRCYFGPNTKLKGKRLVGITVLAPQYLQWIINNSFILQFGNIDGLSLTLVNRKKEEIVKDFPLRDLSSVQTLGKTRIFNCEIDLESSYVTSNNPNTLTADVSVIFNFYTINPETDSR